MACTTVYYWVGATNERFTIANNIGESSVINTTPNGGTNIGGVQLNEAWVLANFNVVNRFTFKEAKSHRIQVVDNNSHALIIIPSVLKVENISETVFGGDYLMTDGIHYHSMPMTINGKSHTCYYLRDLTNTTFPVRHFYFEVSINV